MTTDRRRTIAESIATTHAILVAVVSGDEELFIDDDDLLPVLRVVIDGMARRLATLGADASEIEAARAGAMEAARDAYVRLWIRQSYDDMDEGAVDQRVEREAALRAFALAERG